MIHRAAIKQLLFMQKKSGAPLKSARMGEEKPDEELMGKRKSSPRLSTTLVECRYPKDAQGMVFYTCLILSFSNGGACGTIAS
ncbi:hypothetical protein C5G87_08835 [Paenibacillus peoriae]|jgi:hypothetical protein|nr:MULTISPECIES: hypothetical protein [Paenibacillus]AUJ88347.1 hypothetical protein PPYC1_24415 [Paenibacillus polymyxa]KOS02426.1 hypothetical protein AM598_12210 [Paenibacillus polymyxa]PPQ49448.1 hypothetical protein C5G87_08835 [Paenibacillus peoriae]